MNQLLLLTWEIIINTTEIILFTILVFNRLIVHESRKRKAFLLSGFLVLIVTIINTFSTNLYFSLIIMLVLEIGYCLYFFTNSITEKLFWGCSFLLITVLSEKITFGIFSLLPIDNINSLLAFGENRFHATILYICTCAALVFIVTKFHKDSFLLPSFYKVLLLFITIMIIIGANALLGIILDMQIHDTLQKYTIILNLINYSFIFIFFSFVLITREMGILYKKNLEMQVLHEKIRTEEEQLELYQNTTHTLRTWKHDYQNHIDIIWNLSQNKKYTELTEYLNSFHSALPDSSFLVSTGNAVLDAIISMKFLTAKQKNIFFHYQIILPDIFIDNSFPITSLLGNLLDNAIEACAFSEQPSIFLTLKPHYDMLYLEVKNNTDGNYIRDEKGHFVSRKQNRNHGIGLKRVQQITKELGGFLEIYPCENLFTVKILIPISTTIGES